MANSIAGVQETITNGLGSNQQEVPAPTDTKAAQPAQDEICRSNMNSKLGSNQQEVPDPAGSNQQEVPNPTDTRAAQTA